MTKHTPGNWVSECVGVSDAGPNGVDVYEVNNGYRRIAEYMTEGDARLLAAAPELLEALRGILNAPYLSIHTPAPDAEQNAKAVQQAYDAARAAIRAATGADA
jgi:hypothetical protein